jgi:hypothetical protein
VSELRLTACCCRETSETVAKLELWHNVLVATLDVVKRLVKAQTWLAHTGRTMQV